MDQDEKGGVLSFVFSSKNEPIPSFKKLIKGTAKGQSGRRKTTLPEVRGKKKA